MNQYNVTCPACKHVSTSPVVNQLVVCCRCGHEFVAQASNDSSQLSPEYLRSLGDLRRNPRSAANPERSLFQAAVDFFDPTFKHYVTPWIVRITWIQALISAAIILTLAITGRLGSVFINLLGKLSPSIPPVGRPPSAIAQFGADLIGEIVGWFLVVSWLAIWLLWLRVALELCIVLFDISNSLKQNRDSTRR